jgi:hypothetical protein
MIVAGDEADRIARLECGVDHHGGDTGSRGLFDGTNERVLVERRQHDPIHSLREKPLHNLHLLLTVILAKRPFPDDLDVDVLRAKVARRFDCSGMNALPELVRRPLRDHRDGKGFRRVGRSRSRGFFLRATNRHESASATSTIRFMPLPLERVVKRSDGSNLCALIRHRDRQNADLIVVREGQL